MNKQKLKEQEQEIKRKIRELDKKIKTIENRGKSTEEYKKLDNEEKKRYKERKILDSKISEIKRDIRLKYLDENTSHIIYKETEYPSRNIRPETINAIKRVLGIKNISLLNNGEIIGVVEKLIDNQLDKNKEYQNAKRKDEENEDRLDKIEVEKNKLRDNTDKEWNERQALYTKLDKIDKIKRYDNEKDKKKMERWKKEDETRKRFKKFGENLDKIDIAITKEKIVNDLEEEE